MAGRYALIPSIRHLSPRERDVVYLLRAGRSYAATAEILGVSHGTVRTYAERAFRKLGIVSRYSLPPVAPSPQTLEKLRTKLRTPPHAAAPLGAAS